MMRWGLIPRHTKAMPDYSSVLKSINARDDSLFMGPTGKPMFSHSKNHKRCILLAEGFYEWKRRGKDRTPFYTKRRDGQLMLMAAIYDVAQLQGVEEPLYTYATITTNASTQLDWLHDRMPVLLPNHDHEKIRMWLDPNLPWNTALEAMLKPCDEFASSEERASEGGGGTIPKSVYALETYQVDDRVNSVRNDSPEFAKPWNSSSNKKTLNRFFVSKAKVADSEGVSVSERRKDAQQDSKDDDSHDRIQGNTRDIKPDSISEDQIDDLLWNEQDGLDSHNEDQHESKSKQTSDLSQEDRDDDHRTQKESPGSVDLERRRRELEQEEEEMKKVLEISRLQAIAEGHKDAGVLDSTLTSQSGDEDELKRREQEELERAIAASLSDTGPSKVQPSEQPKVSKGLSELPAINSTGSESASPASPMKKRKPTSSASARLSKKEKPSRDSKITSFFQPTSTSGAP
ncbi:hypothetical protein BGX31_010686 [Mortierella sp. GBA43]|nr:hypothetical protein BGX31_010686 [Mortierella sp. GBA43]